MHLLNKIKTKEKLFSTLPSQQAPQFVPQTLPQPQHESHPPPSLGQNQNPNKSKLINKTRQDNYPNPHPRNHNPQSDYLTSKAKLFLSSNQFIKGEGVFGQILQSEVLNDILLLKIRNYNNDQIILSLSQDALYDPQRVKYLCVKNTIKYQQQGKKYCIGLKTNIVHAVYKE